MRSGRTYCCLALAALVTAPAVSNAQADPYLGPSIGVFFPSNSNLRDAMGDAWISFGASRVRLDPYAKQNVGFDWNAFSKDNDGNRVFMLVGSMGYTIPFSKPGDSMRPYLAVRGGLTYIDYAVNLTPANRVGGKKIGANANVEIGINVGDRLNVSARYDIMPSYDSLNFSGFSLALKWGIAKF
ncbi:MAG: outer membrane beta-barrel protein [Armatimonadetes bacterium]|nr:outer membrane beta-barrel protein [Armatimonadota bacterium]